MIMLFVWWQHCSTHISKTVALSFINQSNQRRDGLPEEGELVSIHPWLELQGGVLPKRRYDEAEEQSDQDEHSRQDNLK